jgi:hypothetical protein
MTKSKVYSLALSFSISLLIHAIILGVGIWYVVRHIAPLISAKPSVNGDGVEARPIYLPNTPWAKIDQQMAPDSSPLIDVATAVPGDADVKFVDPRSAMGRGVGSIDTADGDDAARFGVPSPSQAPYFVPRFQPDVSQPAQPSDSPSSSQSE